MMYPFRQILMNPSDDLPVPQDNGAASHLKGMKLPSLILESTRGGVLDLSGIQNWPVIYCYPMTGRLAVPLPEGWNAIPGARGYSRKAVRSGIITGNCNSRGRRQSEQPDTGLPEGNGRTVASAFRRIE